MSIYFNYLRCVLFFYMFFSQQLVSVASDASSFCTVLDSPDANNYEEIFAKFNISKAFANTFLKLSRILKNVLCHILASVIVVKSENKILLANQLQNLYKIFDKILFKAVYIVNTIEQQEMFQGIDTFLNLQENLNIFVQKIDSQLSISVRYLNETIVNYTTEVDVWTKLALDEMRSLNETTIYGKSCDIIDKIVDEYLAKLESCCHISIIPMGSLCKYVKDLVYELLIGTIGTLERFQMCIDDKNSYTNYMKPCISLVIDEIKKLFSHLSAIKEKFIKNMFVKVYYSDWSVVILKKRTSSDLNLTSRDDTIMIMKNVEHQ